MRSSAPLFALQCIYVVVPACPVCRSQDFEMFVDRAALDAERSLRERFIQARLSRPASESERKDLTDFFHGGRAELLRCRQCTQVVRRELDPPKAAEYSSDSYDPSVMESQYPRYLRAFRAKSDPYRQLLPPEARIIEVGSHYGAFLETATGWGWRAEGVDVGCDTTRFARSKGFIVHSGELQDCRFEPRTFDGVFVWNCFEQIEDPEPLLTECSRILKHEGLLVLRTPNEVFYSICRQLLLDSALAAPERRFVIDALGYNNLLGFPYLYGYGAERLEHCVQPFGFERQGMLNSELLTLPLPEDPDWVKLEERTVNEQVKFIAQWTLVRNGALAGPWIECWFRLRKSQNIA